MNGVISARAYYEDDKKNRNSKCFNSTTMPELAESPTTAQAGMTETSQPDRWEHRAHEPCAQVRVLPGAP